MGLIAVEHWPVDNSGPPKRAEYFCGTEKGRDELGDRRDAEGFYHQQLMKTMISSIQHKPRFSKIVNL